MRSGCSTKCAIGINSMILWYIVILREFKSRRIVTSCEIMWNRRSKSSNTRSCFCERLWITSIKPCQCLRQSDVLRRTPAQWRKWRNTDKRIEMGQIWTNPNRKKIVICIYLYIYYIIYILYYIYYIYILYIIYILYYIYTRFLWFNFQLAPETTCTISLGIHDGEVSPARLEKGS